MQQADHQTLLSEIFLAPSKQFITDRFSVSQAADPAPCTGKCSSGVCRTVTG
jgi:hypothetical protein